MDGSTKPSPDGREDECRAEDGEGGGVGEVDPPGCGLAPGRCAPRPLQPCAAIGPFTANVSGLFFVNVAFFTYYLGTIRTLEKRFDMSSTKSGFTLVLMDVMFALLSLVVGYLGRRAHKPRVMVVCQLLTSVGIFMLALPVVVYGPHRPEPEPTPANSWSSPAVRRMPSEAAINRMIGLCVPGHVGNVSNSSASAQLWRGESCAEGAAADAAAQASEESKQAYALLLCGSLLIGLGGVAVSNLGVPYIDENVESSESACYIGAATSAYSWAPIIGLLLSALCTRIPETLTDDKGLKPSHPSYIGAWWLGMVILGTLSLGLALPMAMFPKHLRHYYVTRGRRPQVREQAEGNGLGSHLKEFWRLTVKFLTNGPYVALLLSKICGLYGVTGVILQLPRYMEIHYRQPAYIASIIAAFSGGIVGALGTVLGGLVLRRLRLETRGVALLFTMATAFGALGTGVCMLYGCPQADLQGQWDSANGRLAVGSACSSRCGCTETMFVPVCTEDRRTYFSPCHAGCQHAVLKNNTYQECDCVGPGANATGGYCGEDTCRTMVPYIITFIAVSFLVAFGRVPATILMFRLVDEKEKAPVMGLTSFFVNILCFVPAPLLFGVLFDSACLVWKSSCAADKGACLVYDTRRFRLLMHGVTLAFQVPSLIFAGITLFLVRNIKNSKSKESLALANKSAKPLLVEHKNGDIEGK